MDLAGIVNLAAIILGPLFGVWLTVWTQDRRAARDRKENLLRALLMSRALPGDPAYHVAINSIPLEYGNHPKVVTAWENYIDLANKQKLDGESVNSLVAAMLAAMGYKEERAARVVRGGYLAAGFAENVILQRSALQAVVRIADAIERPGSVDRLN